MKSFGEHTLLEALSFKGGKGTTGAKEILLRASVASLMNACFHETQGNPIGPLGAFPYTTAEIKVMVNGVLGGSRGAMLELASHLDMINNGIDEIDWPPK
jgi:hypothetical protein